MAGFELRVVEDERSAMSMRVIVGRAYRSTPAFSESVKYLVLNPYWNIPTSIASADILPKLRQDPGYLARQGIRIFSDWSEKARELDPLEIDWSQVAGSTRFRARSASKGISMRGSAKGSYRSPISARCTAR